MSYKFLFLSFLLGSNPVFSIGQSLQKQLINLKEGINSAEIIKCKSDSTLFIAQLIAIDGWDEELAVVKFVNGKILWQAQFQNSEELGSQSIRSARQITLKGIPNLLIEVFDETHMGNGFYYLYKLSGKRLILLASTYAVDAHEDGSIKLGNNKTTSQLLKGYQLQPKYTDVNKDGFVDILLTGTIQIGEGNMFIKEYPAQKVLLYNPKQKKFIEDFKRRKGFKPDDL